MRQLILLMLMASFAISAERSGPFFTLGYGVSRFYDDGYLQDESFDRQVDDSGRGVRVGLGFYIDRHLSVALEYNDFGDYYGRDDAGTKLETSFISTGIVVTINTPPIVDSVEVFARLGASELQWNQQGVNERSDQAGALMIGGGVRYRYSAGTAFSLDYSNHAFKLVNGDEGYAWDVDALSLSAEVMF